MQKINDITYEVKNGESITIDVVPTNFLGSLSSVEAELDKVDLDNNGTDNAPSFSFTVTKHSPRTHRVFMEFNFVPTTPPTACYEVSIAGENDIGCPCGFDICMVDETRELTIAFDVVD